MRLTIAELMRTLEYIPKDTAPDLHEKVLGHLITARFHEALSDLKGAELDRKYLEIFNSLTDVEKEAWVKTGAKIY